MRIHTSKQPVLEIQNSDSSSKSREMNDSILLSLLALNNVKEPKIVLAQAKLETGRYRSHLCRKYHNLFGIRYGKKYAHFKTFEDSVIAYRDKVQYKWKEGKESYYAFLKRIGYATNKNYVSKVKALV